MRRMLRFTAIVAILVGGCLLAAKMYLGSSRIASQVAARLQDSFGVPVAVGGVEVGLSACAATDLTIGAADSVPFIKIARADVDVGIADFISGDSEPTKVILDDAVVTLRFDHDGTLITKLPQPKETGSRIPEIVLRRGTLTFLRDGWPDCTFRGADVTITETNTELQLHGKVVDPTWGGEWQIEGSYPRPAGPGLVHLKSPGVQINPELLRRIPFVEASVWTHFSADGNSPVDLHLVLAPAPTPVRYRVTLAPFDTQVRVPSIDINASGATGKVVVEDKLVTFRDARGTVASGDLLLKSAELNFRQPVTQMTFDLEATRLNLKGLPPSWRLPPRLGGQLTGVAKIAVRIVDGLAIPAGTGEGKVDRAAIGIIPFPNYGLRIQADRDGFKFEPFFGASGLKPPAAKP